MPQRWRRPCPSAGLSGLYSVLSPQSSVLSPDPAAARRSLIKMVASHILAIDQGTTSTRAVVYDGRGNNTGSAARELTQHYPRPGWVEHDAEEIWQAVAAVVPRALEAAGVTARDLAPVRLTNQRESTGP